MSTPLEKLIGGYLTIEDFLSIKHSQDQRYLPNIGRLERMGIVKNSIVLSKDSMITVKRQHSAVNMAVFLGNTNGNRNYSDGN